MTAYVRPSYTELLARIESDLAAVPAALRGPLATALAQSGHGQHGHLDWIDRQCSPLTCELERLYDWAALYKVDRLPARAATGNLITTGNAGAQVLAGVKLRGQNGLDYTVPAAVLMPTDVPVRCDVAGSAGNLAAGQTLTLIDPIPGVASTLTVGPIGLTGGAEEEDVEAWRLRVADEWQTVTTRGARSGKPEDYRFWAKSAHPSVTGALVQPHALGTGTVLVRPICNGLPNRMPTQGVLDAVAAFYYDIAPATADWRLAAPIRRGVGVTIDLAADVDTAANRAAIAAALGVTVLTKSSELASLVVAEVDAAVATVTTQYVRSAPTATITVAAGEVLVLDPVVWL